MASARALQTFLCEPIPFGFRLSVARSHPTVSPVAARAAPWTKGALLQTTDRAGGHDSRKFLLNSIVLSGNMHRWFPPLDLPFAMLSIRNRL